MSECECEAAAFFSEYEVKVWDHTGNVVTGAERLGCVHVLLCINSMHEAELW